MILSGRTDFLVEPMFDRSRLAQERANGNIQFGF
jgi:hypothetical protein